MDTFKIQDWQNLENVNEINMSENSHAPGQMISAYFNRVPAICSGIGNIKANFGQHEKTNTFSLLDGVFRLRDKDIGTQKSVHIFSIFTGLDITIAWKDEAKQQYAVVKTTPVRIDQYRWEITSIVLDETKNIDEIKADETLEALFTLDYKSGVYMVGTDENCMYNYYDIFSKHTETFYAVFNNDNLEEGIYNFSHGLGTRTQLIPSLISGKGQISHPDIYFTDENNGYIDFNNLTPIEGYYKLTVYRDIVSDAVPAPRPEIEKFTMMFTKADLDENGLINIKHGLGNTDEILYSVRNDYMQKVDPDYRFIDANTFRLDFSSKSINGKTFKILIIAFNLK